MNTKWFTRMKNEIKEEKYRIKHEVEEPVQCIAYIVHFSWN